MGSTDLSTWKKFRRPKTLPLHNGFITCSTCHVHSKSRGPSYKMVGIGKMDRRKIDLTRKFAGFALRRFADGRLVPVLDTVFDWKDVAKVHQRMEANVNVGKIVLRVTG